MIPAINPPRRKPIFCGARLAKLLAGETTLAAMLVLRVATSSTSIEMIPVKGLWFSAVMRASSCTGSQIASP